MTGLQRTCRYCLLSELQIGLSREGNYKMLICRDQNFILHFCLFLSELVKFSGVSQQELADCRREAGAVGLAKPSVGLPPQLYHRHGAVPTRIENPITNTRLLVVQQTVGTCSVRRDYFRTDLCEIFLF